MNTQLSTPAAINEGLSTVFIPARSKVISAADVWNIQRNKRVRIQRRFSL